MPFLHYEIHKFCMKILFFNFHMDSINILLYWKFMMKGVVHLYYVWFMFELDLSLNYHLIMQCNHFN
jgi:hypothetical protein